MLLSEVLHMGECLEEVFEDLDPDLLPGIQTGREMDPYAATHSLTIVLAIVFGSARTDAVAIVLEE